MGDTEDRAFEAEREVGLINTFFPILPLLGNRWAASRPWEGLTVGVNMHLTTLTAALLRELTLGGGTFVVSAASPATTDPGTVQLLRNLGLDVYTGGDMENRHLQVLSHEPQLIVDVGFELVQTLLEKRPDLASNVRGAIEVTRSGITLLRRVGELPFPIVNINDGRLKDAIENRHGVGQAVWEAVTGLTKMHLAGRRAVVVGYGPVGKGLALHARASGMTVGGRARPGAPALRPLRRLPDPRSRRCAHPRQRRGHRHRPPPRAGRRQPAARARRAGAGERRPRR